MKLLELLRAQEDESGSGNELEIAVPRLQERLRAQGVHLMNASLLKLLAGWARGRSGSAGAGDPEERGTRGYPLGFAGRVG